MGSCPTLIPEKTQKGHVRVRCYLSIMFSGRNISSNLSRCQQVITDMRNFVIQNIFSFIFEKHFSRSTLQVFCQMVFMWFQENGPVFANDCIKFSSWFCHMYNSNFFNQAFLLCPSQIFLTMLVLVMLTIKIRSLT